MTSQTQDAVREAAQAVLDATPHAETCELGLDLGPRTNLCSCDRQIRAMIAFAALDSRAGDAGEGLDRLTLLHCAEVIRDRAVTVSAAPLGGGYVSEASKIAARHLISAAEAIEKTASATPAPAVDAVPAGEVERLREALTAEDEYWAASRAYASALPRLRESAQAVLSAATARRDAARAALSHGEGRK